MRSYTKVLIWGIIWLFVWIISTPFRHRRDNCLSWAIEKWERDGGYLVIRWCRTSKHSWMTWPHFLWLPEDKHHDLQHAIPVEEQDDDERLVPKLWFNPRFIQGDPEDVREN